VNRTGEIAVFGATNAFGRRVTRALEHEGFTVRAVDTDLDDRAAIAAALRGDVRGVVYSQFDPATLEPLPFVDVDPTRWYDAGEGPLRRFVHVVEASYPVLAASRGALVCVCPTTALQGAANFALLSAVAEGQRVLAKSAARQWANDGICVNIVSPAIDALLDQAADEQSADARRGRVPVDGYDLDAALREVLPHLLTARAVTALTVPIDGAQVTAL
jgi:NAD(P)-dependent dehydrogenase (short-subunit alcohol dehydrogenase family)